MLEYAENTRGPIQLCVVKLRSPQTEKLYSTGANTRSDTGVRRGSTGRDLHFQVFRVKPVCPAMVKVDSQVCDSWKERQ
ncbi:unnamed protein product [Eretmochelys imbricata]